MTRPRQRPERRYASVKTAAELYDVDEKTVRRWISKGLITGYRVGSTLIRVNLNEVEDRVVTVIPAAGQASLEAWRERHRTRT